MLDSNVLGFYFITPPKATSIGSFVHWMSGNNQLCKDLWVGKRPMFNSLKYYLSWQRIDKLKKILGVNTENIIFISIIKICKFVQW